MAEALTGVSAAGARGTVTPRISIKLTGVSASGAIGHMTKTSGPGESFNLVLPALVLQMSGVTGTFGELAIHQPLPDVTMTGDAPVAGSVMLRAKFGLAMGGVTGTTGTLVLKAPKIGLSFDEGASLVLELPLPTLTMAGGAGAIGALDLRTLLPKLAMRGETENIGVMAFPLRLPRLVMDMASGSTGTLRGALPKPTLKMEGVTGTLGELAIAQPLPELVLSGNFAAVGVLAISSPAVRLLMEGFSVGAGTPGGGTTDQDVSAAATALAYHADRGALTKYTNFGFNSYAVFGGRVLGASPQGLFELVGADDAGTAIQAVARFGITDLGSSTVKRVEHVYVGYRTTAQARALLLRTHTNGTQQRDYGVGVPATAGVHTTRVNMGKGVEARYWQFELRNRDGADFSLDTLDVLPTPLRRRRGAKDA